MNAVLGGLRLHVADKLGLIPRSKGKEGWRFAWITDFPLFEHTDEGKFVAAHHPFTSPNAADIDRLESDPGSVRARAYDLVLNGNEIAGGSIRIHRSDLQARVFRALGLSDEDANAKFGFLLEAFKYGPPPHGGIAAGVDRLAMLLCGADSLRDVIAFPKTQKGTDMMTEAPGPCREAAARRAAHRAQGMTDAAARRAATLERLASRTFDLFIVGGGASGAAAARDAALRGLDVALCDAGDFAGETSSQSSKLIHGGLRYLQYGDLHLVFEGLTERRG